MSAIMRNAFKHSALKQVNQSGPGHHTPLGAAERRSDRLMPRHLPCHAVDQAQQHLETIDPLLSGGPGLEALNETPAIRIILDDPIASPGWDDVKIAHNEEVPRSVP